MCGDVVPIDQLNLVREKYADKKIVFTNGCFDILHRGHIELLKQARALGDILVVGVNSDSSVKTLKGPARPVITADDRAYVLSSLKAVDLVTIFDEQTPVRAIMLLKPDWHVKGGDYKAQDLPEYEAVTLRGGCVKIIGYVEGYSTTSIVQSVTASQSLF